MNGQLSDGRAFLFGDSPTAIDAQVYHVIWFIKGRWAGGPQMLSEFADLCRWEENVVALGHGTPAAMDGQNAIAVAKSATPTSATGVAPYDPQGLKVGDLVTVIPDVNGGEQPVVGTVRYADAETISIDRMADDVGQVSVHFPRAGYRVTVD
jgi:glutathione S-transferase